MGVISGFRLDLMCNYADLIFFIILSDFYFIIHFSYFYYFLVYLSITTIFCLFAGLVGVSVKQKLFQKSSRWNQMAYSLMQMRRKKPCTGLTYQHLNFLKRQVPFGPKYYIWFFDIFLKYIFFRIIVIISFTHSAFCFGLFFLKSINHI